MMEKDIAKVLVTEEEIAALCKKLGTQINNDYKDKKPVIVGLLKGCEPFMTDMVKYIDNYVFIDYMKVTSYKGGVKSTGTVHVLKDVDISVEGKDVIIVDDIVDTGNTIKAITELFKARGCNSVEVCCLLDKPGGRKVDVTVKYPGLVIPTEFVVGYGLDYDELYRNLPYIGVLKEEVYKK